MSSHDVTVNSTCHIYVTCHIKMTAWIVLVMDINPQIFMSMKVMRENELNDARSFLIKMHMIVDWIGILGLKIDSIIIIIIVVI